MRRSAATLALLVALAAPAIAQEPAPRLDRPLAVAAQEARAENLFAEVRCVVCQHEAIADSPAGVAADMRALVREQIAAGATDDQIRADLVRRWGDYVLFRPPVRAATWLLWFGPLILLLAGAGVALGGTRRSRAEPAPLSADEEARLAERLAPVPASSTNDPAGPPRS